MIAHAHPGAEPHKRISRRRHLVLVVGKIITRSHLNIDGGKPSVGGRITQLAAIDMGRHAGELIAVNSKKARVHKTEVIEIIDIPQGKRMPGAGETLRKKIKVEASLYPLVVSLVDIGEEPAKPVFFRLFDMDDFVFNIGVEIGEIPPDPVIDPAAQARLYRPGGVALRCQLLPRSTTSNVRSARASSSSRQRLEPPKRESEGYQEVPR